MTPNTTAEPAIPKENLPSTAGMTTKVIKGSAWTILGQVVPIAASLVTVPFVIRLLGSESYGVLTLVILIPTYLAFADFGMSTSSTKFASEAYANGDAEKEARVVRTASLIALAASLPFAVAMFAASPLIVDLFKVPEHLQDEASAALKIAALTFAVNFHNTILNSPQLARLRMDLNTAITSSFRVGGIVATPIVLYLGGGIIGAALVLLVASLLTLAGHVLVSVRLLPQLAGFTIDRSAVRPLLKFGGSLVLAGLAVALLANLEKLLLSPLVSVRSLAYFSVAFTFAGLISMLAGSMVQSLLPAFSRLIGAGKHDELNNLFDRGMRLNLLWTVPMIMFFIIAAGPFFSIWAGEEFGRESVGPFYILLAGVFVSILAYLPYCAIVAAGRSDAVAKLYWVEVVIFFALTVVLVSRYGVIGAAASWSLRAVFDGVSLILVARKVAGTRINFAGLLGPAAVGVLVFAPAVVISRLYPGTPTLPLIAFAAGGCVYAAAAWYRFFEAAEKEWLLQRTAGLGRLLFNR